MIVNKKSRLAVSAVALTLLLPLSTFAMERQQPETWGQTLGRWGSNAAPYIPAGVTSLAGLELLGNQNWHPDAPTRFLQQTGVSGLATAPLITRAQSAARAEQRPSERAHWSWLLAPYIANIALGTGLASKYGPSGNTGLYNAMCGTLFSTAANTPGAIYALYKAYQEKKDHELLRAFEQSKIAFLELLTDIFAEKLPSNQGLHELILHQVNDYDTKKALVKNSWLSDDQKLSGRALLEKMLLEQLIKQQAIELASIDGINFNYKVLNAEREQHQLNFFPYYYLGKIRERDPLHGFNQDVVNYVGQAVAYPGTDITPSIVLNEIKYPEPTREDASLLTEYIELPPIRSTQSSGGQRPIRFKEKQD